MEKPFLEHPIVEPPHTLQDSLRPVRPEHLAQDTIRGVPLKLLSFISVVERLNTKALLIQYCTFLELDPFTVGRTDFDYDL